MEDVLKRGLSGELRASLQTTGEWLKELKTGEKVPPAILTKGYDANTKEAEQPDEPHLPTLIITEHRTTKEGRLVLEFEDQETGELVVDFFNVDITYQRGPKKGLKRKTGLGCQFYPRPKSKFRKFWLKSVGEPPLRWATVHKSLRAQLSKQEFTGEISEEIDSNGNTYLRLRNTRALVKEN